MIGEHPRLYTLILRDHFARHRQMAFVSGPRQVGKTTVCRGAFDGAEYLNFDDADARRDVGTGGARLESILGLDILSREPKTVVFDEWHKHRAWKRLLKGFFDTCGDRTRIIVTGSSRLDVFRRGGDSLMGRYFLYRMHPLSIGEIVRPQLSDDLVRRPVALADADFSALSTFGGFPEPYLKRDPRFFRKWQTLRRSQLLREDIRDLTAVQDLGRIEIFGDLLAERSGTTLVYSTYAKEIGVSVDTIRRWTTLLQSLHFGFLVRPWFKNVAKSLRKEPKWYLHDWSDVADPGARTETFVAAHLLKAVEHWQDTGMGTFELRYLRDKDKREVDFLVVRDKKPWFLVEAKTSETTLSPHLAHFQKQIGAPHAFQVVFDLPFVDADPFDRKAPCVVPARTLLSQLV